MGMRIRDFFKGLSMPLAFACAVFVIGTILAQAVGTPGRPLAPVFSKLDLRHEFNLASWFQSTLFLVCAATFALLGWSRPADERVSLPRFARYVAQIGAVACVFFSADEMLMLHERMGILLEEGTGIGKGTAIEGLGFSWVLVYAPLALAGAYLVLRMVKCLLERIPDEPPMRRRLSRFLWIIVLGVPALLALEATEALSFLQFGGAGYLTCVEEGVEILILWAVFRSNVLFAEGYQL